MRTVRWAEVGALAVAAAACGGGGSGGGPASPPADAGAAGAAGGGTDAAGPDAADAPKYAEPYSIVAFDDVRIGSDPKGPNFQKATATIDWHDAPFASVHATVKLGTTCFPFEKWKDNPPPPGQNFPADCDAFDRNFELTLDDPDDPATGKPAVEVMRAITPFGGPLPIELDLTDVANALPGKHALRVSITTWSDAAGKVSGSNGGWNVGATIDVVPGPAPRKVLAVVPLWNGSQGPSTSIGAIPFEAPPGTKSGRIEVRATGHGGGAVGSGCIGPAEEFCKRTHTYFVDEAQIAEVVPWRSDCDTLCTIAHQGPSTGGFDYCKENPTGAIQSVKAPRANWCPGSLTPPFEWTAEAPASPGAHTFRWTISKIADKGSWRMSATYFAFAE